MMRLRFSAGARRDLLAIARYISGDSPSRAASFVEELIEACSDLVDQPERYALIPRYGKRGLRRRPYGNYSIIYDVGVEQIHIVRIVSAARDLNNLLD